jgi:hypothetical protein
MHEQIPVSELKVGDVLVGVGVVEQIDHDFGVTLPQARVLVAGVDVDLYVPPTFMCTVERKPKVWRRTIVVESPFEQNLGGRWEPNVDVDRPHVTVHYGGNEHVEVDS